MAPSRITTILPIVIYFCLHIQQSSQQECWKDIPIKTENKDKCKECPKDTAAAELLMERVEKVTQVKVDLNCMADNTTGWAGTVQTYSWFCKESAKDCTERLDAYNWTSLADKAAKEAVISKKDSEFKLMEAEVSRLKSCAPKELCSGSKSSQSLDDSRKEAQKMASALNCASDKASGGIDVKGYTFKLPVGVPFLLTPCTKVTTLYTGTNIKTEAFVKETSAKLTKLLKEMYKSSFCNYDYLCPCGDVQLSARIATLVKSVKCTKATAVNADVTTLLADLGKLLTDSEFSYTETCAANEKPSDKPNDVRNTISQITEALSSWKIAKKLCPCLVKRKSGRDNIKKTIEAWAQDATCANKALADKTAAKPSIDAIKKVTDTLKITTDEAKCSADTLTDPQRNTKIQTLAARVTKFSQDLDLLSKCPCTKKDSKIDKSAIKSAKFEADCWFKKISAPSDNLKAQKTKIDEFIKKLRKHWQIEEYGGKDGKDMENASECRKNKDTVDDAAVLKKLTDIYTGLEELSKQGEMMNECACKVCATEDTIFLLGKIESLAKDAACSNKDLTDKAPAKASMDAIKKITDALFITLTEVGCPTPTGDAASRLSNIQKLAARIPIHNAQFLATWNCPCGKVGDGCPCKVSLVKSALEKYGEVKELSNQAYCVDPKMDTTADATVKAAWAKIVPIYKEYYLEISKNCHTPDATATAATPADKVKVIAAIEVQLKDMQSTIKTYEDAIVVNDPLGQVFEKVYTKHQMRAELNCIAAELKKLTPAWTGTITAYPWLCSTQTSDCTAALAKNKWSTLADNTAKTAVLTKLDGEYKTLMNEIISQSSCLGCDACSSGKAQLETRTTAQMQADATKMSSALKCATDTANSGITVAGYTFSQPVAVPTLKSCADAVKDYTGTDIKTAAFVKDTDAKLQTLLKDFYDVSFCRREGLCQCGSEEMQVNIDNLVKSVKCTDATKEVPRAAKRMEALDITLHNYNYKFTEKCASGKKPSDNPNTINNVIQRLPKMLPIWMLLGQQCSCQTEKATGRSGTKKVIETLAQEATCLNKALTVKTGAQTKLDAIKKVTDALKQTITETPCTAVIGGTDTEKTAKISKLADRITALFSGYTNIDACPCCVRSELASIENFAKTQIRKTNCAEQNLAKPNEATEFKAAKAKIDVLAKQYDMDAKNVQACEKITTTDAALTTEVKKIATDLETLAKKAEELKKECPCKSSKGMNDIKVYNRIQSLAQEAVCLNKELSVTDKVPAKANIDAIKVVTDALLMTVTETSCSVSTGTPAMKQAKITNIASRVSLNNKVLDWVRKCPCTKSDKTELKLCGDKNAVIKMLLDELDDLEKILEKANCIVPDLTKADATVKTAFADFTTSADKYVIKAGKTCPRGFTAPTVAADQVKALKVLQGTLNDVTFKIEFYEESLLATDCSVSQFYQKYNSQMQLKTAMNCVVLELKKLTPPWSGTISANNWLCEKAAKDCTEWLAKYKFSSKPDNAAKTGLLTQLEAEYNKIEKQMSILDESTKEVRYMRGTQFLVSNTAGELYKELQKMQSALKCATDTANSGVTVAGYTWAMIPAIPFLTTPCSKVTAAYTGTNIKTNAFVKDTNTKLQAALKTYLEVFACRFEGACPGGNHAMQAKLTGIIKAVKCTAATTTNAVASASLNRLDKVLKCNSFPYTEKCAQGEKPSIVAGDVDQAIESAKQILPKWEFLNDLCLYKSEEKANVDQLTRIIDSEATTATCYNKELANKATAQAKMTEIKTVTDALGLAITETGCTASTLTDAKRLEAITKLAASVGEWNTQMTTVKTCPGEKLAGIKIRNVKDVFSRFKKTADCRQADLKTASDAGFKAQKDKIDALAKKYEIDAAKKPDCVPDTASTDAQLTAKVTDIFTNMEKLAAILDEGKTCPCKLKAAQRDLKLYSLIEAQATLAACKYQNLTDKAPAQAKMGEILAITDALFMKITATSCANTTGDDASISAAIGKAAERVTIHNTQYQNGRSCPCPGGDKNECPCKLDKINSAMEGYKQIGGLVKRAKCIEPSATITDNDLATAVKAIDQYIATYGVKVTDKCSTASTNDAKAKTEEINKIGKELQQLVEKIKLLEDCACPAESVILKTASENKLSDYFYKAKCVGEKYKTEAAVSAAVREIDTIIAAQLVAYKTDCTGFVSPAMDAANASLLIGKQKTLIESEIGKLDKIDKCRGLPEACRAGLRPLKIALNSTKPMDIESPGWSDDNEGKLCGVKCLWSITWAKQLEVTYAAKDIDIKAKADKTCGDNKLCLKLGEENKTAHCAGRDVQPNVATKGPLIVTYVNKGTKDCGKGFKMPLKPSYAGCGKKASMFEVEKPGDIEFSSPTNDEGKYPDNLNCTYEVKYDPQYYACSYKSVGALDINSTDTKLCAEDVLKVTDSENSTTICGKDAVPDTLVKGGKLAFNFVTDATGSGAGFKALFTCKLNYPKACDAGAKTPIKLDKPDVHEVEFFGNGYPESLNCEWNYQWDTAVFDVQFCFPKIAVTGSMPACANDKIDTTDGQTKKPFCGPSAVSCITADSGNLTIGFISDATKAADGKGFKMVIKVAYQACTNAKKAIVTELTKPGNHILKFYNPEKYSKDLNCTFTYKWNLQYLTVRQKLKNIDIDAKTNNCSNATTDDYLERSDGKVATRVCGTVTEIQKKPLELTTGLASYNFISNPDDKVGTGFIIEFEITKRVLPKACRGGDTISIKLPGNTTLESLDRDQDLPYLSNLNCSTTLISDPKRLRLSLTTVGVVDIKSPDAKCENDSLVIQDGEKGNKTKHCQDTKIETPIELKSGAAVISFSSDGANEGKGYSVVVTAELPKECAEGTTIEISGTAPTFVSSWAPADGENYIGGLNCTWTVTWNKQKIDMKVKSVVMDIEQSSNCVNDYVMTQAGGAAPQKQCGTSAIAETAIDSKFDNYTVSFVSDGDTASTTTGKGFKLQFTPSLRKLPEGCSWGKECSNPKKITIPDVNKNYTITSPDRVDGLDYPPGVCCQYEFSWASDKMDVVYGFLNLFETEGNATYCDSDYVEVKDGASEEVKNCGKKQYSATLSNDTQQSANANTLVFKFESDNTDTSVFKGFEAIVKSVELEACSSTKPKKIVLKEGDVVDIMTPGFVSSGAYGNNKNCSWEFEFPAGLAFEGRFVSVDLEASAGCTKDYAQLEQGGYLMGRVCGTYMYPVEPKDGGAKSKEKDSKEKNSKEKKSKEKKSKEKKSKEKKSKEKNSKEKNSKEKKSKEKGNNGRGKGRRRRHTFRWSRAAIDAAAYGHPFDYPSVAGGKVTFIFVTDAQNVKKGAHFKAKLVQPKGPIDGAVKNITMDTRNKQVIITSPGYKYKIPVHPSTTAEWAIKFNKDKYSIACGFADQLEISADTDTACPKDKLVLQDANDTAATFCVNKTYVTDLKALDLPIKAENELSVKMTTDKATGRGFMLVCQLFGAIPPACKGNGAQTVKVTNNGNIKIQSPGFDDRLPYPNGLNCTWNITCPNKRIVMYGEGELDLEGTATACDKDTVTVLEAKRGTDKDQTLQICGKKQYAKGKKDKLFEARYNGDVTVSFVTSNKTNGVGFSLLLNYAPCRADCMGACDGKARMLCSQFCIDGITGKTDTMKQFENVTDCAKRCIVNNTKLYELDSCNRCMLTKKKSEWGSLGSLFMDCAKTCHTPFAIKKNGADIAKNTTDTCNQCIYGDTKKTLADVKDVCGVCGGKGDTCLDCNKKPNGGAVIDACGVCGGDGTTCQNVPSKVIPDIIPSETDLTIRVEGAGFKIGKVNEVVVQDKAGKEVLKVSTVVENNQNLTTATFKLPAGDYQVFTKTASGTLSQKSLTLKVYDSTITKVTDLSPKEALISTVKTKYSFTFTTENVEDTKKIVCVFIGLYDVTTIKIKIGKGISIKTDTKTTRQPYVMKVPFNSATEIKCELDLAIAKSRELTVFASLNGGYHPLTKTFTFPIMAPPPKVTSSKFSDDGSSIDIEFTSAVETRKLKRTSDMFDNFNVFGDKATRLNWKSVKSLRVLIGKGSKLVEIDTVITFKADAVKSFGQHFSKALTGTAKVLGPDNAKNPVAILTGATEAATCDVLEFVGDQSYGAAGRAWKVFKYEGVDEDGSPLTLPAAVNGKLTLPGENLKTNCKVKLTVTNFLGQTKSVEVKLKIVPSPVPKVRMISDKGEKGLKRSDTFTVCAKAELPGGTCKSDAAVKFEWNFPGMDPNQANARCYLFRQYTIGVGKVQITVSLSLGASTDKVSRNLELEVVSEPLIAVISNAPAKLGSSSKPAKLSCLQSIDPDRDATKKLSCQWFCQTADGPCMTISDKQIDPFIGDEYTVDPTTLIPNTVYTINLKVSKGTRTASDSKQIRVVAGDPPSVIIIPNEGKADSASSQKLLSFVNSVEAITSSKWTSLDKSADGKEAFAVAELDTKWELSFVIGGTTKSMYMMVLPPNTLNAGAKYLFSLQVFTASSNSTSLVVVETAPIITGCVLALPSIEYMESDEIELSTAECVASQAQYPLTYTFKKRTTNDGDLTLAPTSNTPSAKIPGPKATSNGKITFVSTVCDSNGNCFDFVKADVVVKPLKQDQSTLDGLVVKMKARYLRLQLMGAFLEALVMNSNFNSFVITIRITIFAGKRRKRAVAASATAVGEKNAIEAIDSVLKGVLSKSTIDTACQQLSSVDINQMVPADQTKFAGQIAKLLEEGAKEGISQTSIKAALKAAEALLDAKIVTEKDYSAMNANAFKGLFKGGSVTQKMEVKTKNSICTTEKYDFSAELTGGDSTRPVGVKFPKEMSQKYSDWACDGTKRCYNLGVVVTHFNAASYTRSTISAADLKEKSTDVVDVTCNNPATGEKIDVKSLTEPVEVKIPVTSGKTCKKHICKYEDSGTWKTDGVTFGGCDGANVVCKSLHLSVFMAVNDPTPIPDGNSTKTTDDGDTTGAIIGGVVGGILAALLVGMFIFFICRIQQRDVIKVDHIEMGKPTMYAYDNTTYTYRDDPDSVVKHAGLNGEPESKVVHM